MFDDDGQTQTVEPLMPATYARLPDSTWGMRVVGAAVTGTRVMMTRKDGTSHEASVGEVVKRYTASPRFGRPAATLARIAHSADRQKPRLKHPKCALCQESVDGTVRQWSPREDQKGKCRACCPRWAECRRCAKVLDGYYHTEDGGAVRTCPKCEAEEVFDQAVRMGEESVDKRMAAVQLAFDHAAGQRTIGGDDRRQAQFASDLREEGFRVGTWPAVFPFEGRLYRREVEILDDAGEFHGHVYRSFDGYEVLVFNT